MAIYVIIQWPEGLKQLLKETSAVLNWREHNADPPQTNLLSLTAASPAMSSTKEESSGRGWAGLLCGGDEPSWQSMPDPVILHSWERFPGSCTAIKEQLTTQLLMEFFSGVPAR